MTHYAIIGADADVHSFATDADDLHAKVDEAEAALGHDDVTIVELDAAPVAFGAKEGEVLDLSHAVAVLHLFEDRTTPAQRLPLPV